METVGGSLAWRDAHGRATAPCHWQIAEDGSVRLRWGDYVQDMDQLRRLTGPDVRLDVWVETPDTTRQAIIAAGWPLVHATYAEARKANDKVWAEVDAELRAKREVRSGGQREDTTQPATDAITPEPGQIRARIDGHDMVATRIKSVGYGALEDGNIEELLSKHGAELDYAADALSVEYVGTISGGPLTEICYELEGQRWYMYVVLSSMGDSWQQEWWVSHERYTAHAAAEIIEAARDMAYTRGEGS